MSRADSLGSFSIQSTASYPASLPTYMHPEVASAIGVVGGHEARLRLATDCLTLLRRRVGETHPSCNTMYKARPNHTIKPETVHVPRRTPLGRVITTQSTVSRNRNLLKSQKCVQEAAKLARRHNTKHSDVDAQVPYAETDTAAELGAIAGSG